jgi:PEP-CTERM motif-containing protein
MTHTLSRLLVAVGFLVFISPAVARGATISFEATDLEDLSAGEDLWAYRYSLSGSPLQADEGFTVYFDRALYSALTATSTPSGWDLLLLQPDDLIPSDGMYDALNEGGTSSSLFEVSFVWKGEGTQPGIQPYDVYVFGENGLTTTDSGITVSSQAPPSQAPEPSSLLLLSGGLVGVLAARRRRLAEQNFSRNQLTTAHREERA